MKTLKLLLLFVFLLVFLADNMGQTCPSGSVGLFAQDTLGNTINNNATTSCAKPFNITASLSPCVETFFDPSNSNLNSHGQETIYENGQMVAHYTSLPGASGMISNSYVTTDGLDSNTIKTFQFCNTGAIGPATLTLRNCWDTSIILSGPVSWNSPGTAPCLTLTVPPTANIGSAFYTIAPASGYLGFTDFHNGTVYLNPDKIPTGTYTVTYHFQAFGTCPVLTGTFTFKVPVKPVVMVTPSLTTACSGIPTTLTVNGAGTGGTYTWSPGGSNATILNVTNSPAIQTTYTYSVVGTSSTGCHGTGTAIVTVNTLPNLVILPSPQSYTICNGGLQTFTVSGATNYVWTPAATLTGANTASPTASPSTTTVYSVTGTDVNNCSNVSPATVTVNVTYSSPIALAGNSYTICNGSSQTFTVSGAASYSWTPAITLTGATTANPTANPSATTIYTVTGVTSGCVPSNTLTVALEVNPMPTGPVLTGSVPNPLVECQGQNPKSISVTTGTIASTPVWYNGSTNVYTGTTYVPNTSTPGTTIYRVIDSASVGGCKNLSANNVITVTVTINPTSTGPVIGAGIPNPLTECEGQSPQTLTVITTGTVAATPVWYNGSAYVHSGTNYTPGTSITGTTIYTVIDSANAGGCKNLSANNIITVTVTINPSPTGPVIPKGSAPDLTECQGANPHDITVAGTGTVASTPVWYNGSTYVYTGTSYTPGTSIPGTTIYTVIDSANVGGCKNLSVNNVLSITVTINPMPTGPVLPTGSAPNPLVECQGTGPQGIMVAGTGTVASTPVWYNGATHVYTGTTYTPGTSAPGTTVYTIIDSAKVGGCKNLSAGNVLSVTVTINPTPNINISTAAEDTATCGLANGSIVNLNPSDVSGGTQPYHYQWYSGNSAITGDTTLVLNHVTGGTYSLQVKDANGCVATVTGGTSTTFTVPAISKPVVAFSTNPGGTIVIGQVPLVVIFNTPPSITTTTYSWTFGDGTGSFIMNPTHTYTDITTYTVMLVAANNKCQDTAYRIIVAEPPTTIIIPNIFTPNNDGVNDQFFIPNTGMTALSCDIFNRWGQIIYTLNAPDQAWDGRAPDGNKAPDGTYIYLLEAQGLNGKVYKQQGTLTLIR
jgi:gliding motility-associated-like protein